MLLTCTAYQHGRRTADQIPLDDVPQYLAQPNCFVWVGLQDATSDELARLKMLFDLHELAVEDADHGHQRPKIEEYDDELFAVMHLVEERDGKLVVGELHTFVGANYILSIRNNHQQDLRDVRIRCEREPHMLARGSGYAFYALMDAVVDHYFPIISQLESELDALEERIFLKGDARDMIRSLYELKSKATRLKHAISPLLEAVSKLFGGRVPAICVKNQHYFRDVSDHLLRLNASLDSTRDTISTAIQVTLSMVAIEQSDTSKKLAAWAGIFAVATAFAGIWGMNFAHMPELEWQYGYPAALLAIAGTAGMLYWRFRKAKWL